MSSQEAAARHIAAAMTKVDAGAQRGATLGQAAATVAVGAKVSVRGVPASVYRRSDGTRVAVAFKAARVAAHLRDGVAVVLAHREEATRGRARQGRGRERDAGGRELVQVAAAGGAGRGPLDRREVADGAVATDAGQARQLGGGARRRAEALVVVVIVAAIKNGRRARLHQHRRSLPQRGRARRRASVGVGAGTVACRCAAGQGSRAALALREPVVRALLQ